MSSLGRLREGGALSTHLVIPDTQSGPGTPSDHLRWIGKYIIDRKPDVVIHLGDHWDMRSLSGWNSKQDAEGLRYADDVAKGNADLALLTAPLVKYQKRQEWYKPRLVLLRGNHEDRIRRAVEADPRLEGTVSMKDLASPGWEVHDFLKPVFIDGVGYSHFWANPLTGRPYGGQMETRLKTIGHSFTMGHVQTLQTGMRFIHGPDGQVQQRGLVAGACYLHDESYKGYQGNAHWRGILVCHQVQNGGYNLMEVDLDFLCRKYEGVSLEDFKKEGGGR